ncbi:MAG: phosphatase PAP2 family protein [Candidatus Chisholmbacteria bacterium]|nr:phosphatase PAP2 family protein [Candidatus Chisholmbacteria bacterium]
MLELFITFLASFLVWFMVAGLFVLARKPGPSRREMVLHSLLAAFLAWSIAHLIKLVFPTPRPFELNGDTPLTLFAKSDGSFPSGHTALAFALATSVFLHRHKVGLIFILAAIVVGLARVFGNVHYPVDILGGAAIGVTTALLISRH